MPCSVGGVDLRQFPVNEYRRNIGLVLQEPFLFYGTVADNIAYGRPNATRREIVAAARAARVHEFVLRLPDGYDTVVGERGQNLSGGERQRISIARALLVDPAILILDEATSSVDTETELEIQEALENLIQGRTTIAIAHRLSTLRRANRLIVLEGGKIAEVGVHRELLDRDGVYARLHRAQYQLTAVTESQRQAFDDGTRTGGTDTLSEDAERAALPTAPLRRDSRRVQPAGVRGRHRAAPRRRRSPAHFSDLRAGWLHLALGRTRVRGRFPGIADEPARAGGQPGAARAGLS